VIQNPDAFKSKQSKITILLY